MYSSKEAGGNPRSTASHAKVDEASQLMNQAVAELTATLEKAGGEAGLISGEGRGGGGGGGGGGGEGGGDYKEWEMVEVREICGLICSKAFSRQH